MISADIIITSTHVSDLLLIFIKIVIGGTNAPVSSTTPIKGNLYTLPKQISVLDQYVLPTF